MTTRSNTLVKLMHGGLVAALISLPGLALAESVSERGGEDYLFEVEQDEMKVIDRHNVCREVTNLNENHIMVPTGTPEEWYDTAFSFVYFEPENVLLDPCDEAEFPGGDLVLRYDTNYGVSGIDNNQETWRPISSADFPNPQNPDCLAISCLLEPGITTSNTGNNREMLITSDPQNIPFRTPSELNGVSYWYPYSDPQSVPNHAHESGNNIVPLFLRGDYVDVEIDWGGPTDGCPTTVTEPTAIYCEYTSPGVYDVTVSGTVEKFGMGETLRYPLNWRHTPYSREGAFKGVLDWSDDMGLRSLEGAFSNAKFITQIPDFLPSTVEDISYMFAYTSYAGNFGVYGGFPSHYTNTPWSNVESWDVSNVRNMEGTFAGRGSWMSGTTSPFNADLSSWDVGNVENFSFLFNRTNFDQDIGDWDVLSGVHFNDMFAITDSFNQDISDWCTPLVSGTPDYFATSNLDEENRPDWGGCPGSGIFPSVSNADHDVLVASSVEQFPDVDAGNGTITGPGDPEFRVNGGDWITEGEIVPGDDLQIRMRSADDHDVERNAIIMMDTDAFIRFSVTTYDYPIPNVFSFDGPVQTNYLDYTLASDPALMQIRDGYTLPVTTSGSGNPELRVNDRDWTTVDAVESGDVVQIRVNSGTEAFESNTGTLTVGDERQRSADFEVVLSPETATLSTMTVSQSNANDQLTEYHCGGAFGWSPSGTEVNVDDFRDRSDTGPYQTSGGTERYGCVTTTSNISIINGQLSYNTSVTFAYLGDGDFRASPFDLGNAFFVEPGTVQESDNVEIDLGVTDEPVDLSGHGSAELRINGGSWSDTGSVSDGDMLQVRAESGDYGELREIRAAVAGHDGMFDILSYDRLDFGEIDAFTDPGVSVTSDSDELVGGVEAGETVFASVTGHSSAEFRIDDGPWQTSGEIGFMDAVTMRMTSPDSGTRTVGLEYGDATSEFSVTMRPDEGVIEETSISETEYNSLDNSGYDCRGEGISVGDTVMIDDFIGEEFVGEEQIAGETRNGCISYYGCAFIMNGVCQVEPTVRAYYVDW